MARTKQTARKSSGGRAPRKMLACKSKKQFRQFMLGQQAVTYGGVGSDAPQQTSYLNYENMFYSYDFHTGPKATKRFEPRFTSGAGVNPTTKQEEHWLGMSLCSMYDGEGMKTHGRPHLNLVIVLDVSGSMMWPMATGDGTSTTKLTVAKQCLSTLCDQLKTSDSFGLVRFNDAAEVHCKMAPWKQVKKKKLKDDIAMLVAGGATNLSAAIDCATELIQKAPEAANATNRIMFLTDLQSTCDSANDEKRLLSTIRGNADAGIYTTVVGIGMDLNVRLVEDISKTRGAKYCSVSNNAEFARIMNKEFDYDVTIMAFNICITMKSADFVFAKGYGSPEVNSLKDGKSVVISSEFPSWQNERGESKGGMLLFKLEAKKGKKAIAPGQAVKIGVKYESVDGVEVSEDHVVTLSDTFTDSGTRKAALLVQYVDLHNEFVLEKRGKHGAKYLELFQAFRRHFTSELEDMKDKSLATSNKGDLELIDKIIELEMNPKSEEEEDDSVGSSFGGQGYVNPFSAFGRTRPSRHGQRMKQSKVKTRGRLGPLLPPSSSPPSSSLSFKAPTKLTRQVRCKMVVTSSLQQKKQQVGVKQTRPPAAAVVRGVRRSTRKRQPAVTDADSTLAPPSKKTKTLGSKTTAKAASSTRSRAASWSRSTASKRTSSVTVKTASPAKVAKKVTPAYKPKGKSQSKGKAATRSSKRLQQLAKSAQGKKEH